MSDTIKLRPAFVVSLDAEEVFHDLIFRRAIALDDAILLVKLRKQGLDIWWSIIGLCYR